MERQVAKFKVKIKCGNPGEYKHGSHEIVVECENESVAIDMAINKFKNSNAVNRNKECDAVKITIFK